MTVPSKAALQGLKVVEFAQVIAAPMAGTLLADLGADVVHVEDPRDGDPARQIGPRREDTYLWWKVAGRNKRSVTIDLRRPEGQEIARSLAEWADVVITNMRVGTLQSWGMDWPSLHQINPTLIMLQVSGFGANTSKRNVPGFGKVGEAQSGVVNLTGFPDGPPVFTGFSHGDSITGLMGAFAIQVALYRRERDPSFDGEWIDLALFETLFRLVEWQVVVYDQLGMIPSRAGNRLAVAPGAVVNTYQSADREWIVVTSGSPKAVRNVARLLEEPGENYVTVRQQEDRRDHLDRLLREWISARKADECLQAMADCDVVSSRIYTIEDIVHDPIYLEREDIIQVDDPDLGHVRMQGVIPKLLQHPGHVWRTGPGLGQDNEIVLKDYLSIPDARYEALRHAGVIGPPRASREIV